MRTMNNSMHERRLVSLAVAERYGLSRKGKETSNQVDKQDCNILTDTVNDFSLFIIGNFM